MNFEYGIVHHASPTELHRGPMTLDEAKTWIDEWVEMGCRPGAFLIAARAIGEWRAWSDPDPSSPGLLRSTEPGTKPSYPDDVGGRGLPGTTR